jgi:hypothetical protein
MDAIKNPFSPGAGSPPPELVGREATLEQARILLGRVQEKRPEKSILLTGLRGVGKTVLLNAIERLASKAGYRTVSLEAHEDQSLPEPTKAVGVHFEAAALAEICRLTQGYPFFLQEWGYQSWNRATASPITLRIVREASGTVIQRLDANFFRVRFDRLTPGEKRLLRAMAGLGKGWSGRAVRHHDASATRKSPDCRWPGPRRRWQAHPIC